MLCLRNIPTVANKCISSRSGGQAIQSECRDYVRQHGSLLCGDVFVSTAGSLDCTVIVHTVGPVWKGGRRSEENELYEAVHAALTAAGEHKCERVSTARRLFCSVCVVCCIGGDLVLLPCICKCMSLIVSLYVCPETC